MLSIFFFLILGGQFICIQGWGADGHSIIARLAESELTDSASKWIRSLVPWHFDGNLSAMASWADSIIHQNSNPTGFDNWKWSKPLHYLNIPDWNCTYHVNRDCINNICIDGAIRNYTERLQNNLDLVQQQEALYFLIHFVGDIHQPLHTAFSSDFGGNSIEVRFMNDTKKTNLHSLWDSGIIKYHMKNDFQSNVNNYYEYIYKLMIRESKPNDDDDNQTQQWVKESLNYVCNDIYFDDRNRTLNTDGTYNLNRNYYIRSRAIIEKRLAQGGRRLGALLNRIEQNRATPMTSKTSLTLVPNILISVTCVVTILIVIFSDFSMHSM
ncbi:hypothetical protein I4U23_019665 [Adineta vaga]|nr:hypothetical protein I4U23_019665 [Adineta vaga]